MISPLLVVCDSSSRRRYPVETDITARTNCTNTLMIKPSPANNKAVCHLGIGNMIRNNTDKNSIFTTMSKGLVENNLITSRKAVEPNAVTIICQR